MKIDKKSILKKYFGYDNFRDDQEIVIDSILSCRDTLCIMPTGAGKSICYQIPSLIFEGITIVVSPLISLMIDQVQALKSVGVNAAYINSSLTPSVTEKVLYYVSNLKYKIIYVAPERLESEGFLNAIKSLNVSFVVIDEAHCISKWGRDFRPGYLNISNFIKSLNKRPVIGAFTATATSNVKNDICTLLEMRNPFIKITSFDRKNLFFEVKHPNDKKLELLSLIKSRKLESGIVYCSTRKIVDDIYLFLDNRGYNVTKYHAGLSEEERIKNQDDFIYDRSNIMVATNAFGLGIDKSNVSFVIHYNMPKDIESYYQEAGRAGRDGNPASCILLFGEKDIITNRYLIESSEKDSSLYLKDYELLKKMIFYCQTDRCLRGVILDYFGEKHPDHCNNCFNCLRNSFEKIDVSVIAKIILNCVDSLPREYGKGILITVLRGGVNKKILEAQLNETLWYGSLSRLSKNEISEIINILIDCQRLEQIKTKTSFPVLILGKNADDESPIYLEKRTNKFVQKIKFNSGDLFEALKILRNKIAHRDNMPAYLIFSDATLAEMCLVKPTTKAELLKVAGVGEVKCEHYGDEFLAEIIKFKNTKEEGK